MRVNTDTGEVLGTTTEHEENPQDLYDSYTRMRQEEKEILGDPHANHSNSSQEFEHDDPNWEKW
ncbi:hypothetical protein M0L12_RS12075 [Providencia rettgeri]|nr:hypothetical protein [Providencia rettgeri]